MKSFKKTAAIILAIVFALSVTACSAKSSSQMRGMSSSADYAMAAPAAAPDMAHENAEAQETGEGSNIANRSNTNTEITDTSRKLIRRVYLNVETRSFDDLSAQITKRVGELGGYFESSEVGGHGGKGYPEAARAGEPRYARMIIRVPKSNVDAFVGMVSENSNVTAKTETTEDVTLAYVDVESRKKALTIEQERLLVLLGKAEKIEDIIKLEERLSDVRYQLESYGSQLRVYDNQVDYSKVSLDIYEVKRETPAEPTTMSSRIKNGFAQTMYDMGNGLENFTVWFIVNLPYLLIWAVVISIAVLVLRKRLKKGTNSRKGQLPNQITQPIPASVQETPPDTQTNKTKE